jgi:hypothetical protein
MMFTNCFRFRKSRGCAGSGAQKRRNAARASQHHPLMAEIACSYDDAVLPANDPWLQIVADVPSPSTPPGLCLATPPNPALSRSLKKRAGVRTRGQAGASPSQLGARVGGLRTKQGSPQRAGARACWRFSLPLGPESAVYAQKRTPRPVRRTGTVAVQAGEPALSRCRGGPCQRSAQVRRGPGTAAGEGKGW